MTSSFGLSENNVENSAFEEMLLVHKTPTCGCCKMWMKHAEESGMTVYSQDHQNLMQLKNNIELSLSIDLAILQYHQMDLFLKDTFQVNTLLNFCLKIIQMQLVYLFPACR